jgi:soluble lytic murein transglycosylase-like protein
MSDQLNDIRNQLLAASDQLLNERDAAFAAGESAKVTVAEAEIDRINVVLATVQSVMNSQQALNMDAVAKRLQDSVEAQRAIGLSVAAKTLANLIGAIRGPAATATEPAGGQDGKADAAPANTSAAGDFRAKPGRRQAIVDALIAGARDANLDPMLVLTIVAIESDFDPAAVSRVSSAGGLFQFLDGTWTGAGGQTFPGRGGVGNGQAAAAPVEDQVRIGCQFVKKTVADLTARLGHAPSATATYMAHQQGLAGALKILTSDRNAAIEDVVGADAARNNAMSGMTVAQAIGKFDALVRSNEDEARNLLAVGAPPSAVMGAAPATVAVATPAEGTFRLKAVHIALTEMEMFARRDGVVLKEQQPPLAQRVLEYFRLVGRPDITDPSAEPWSAAFISFVMSTAGAAPTQFPISASHHLYILAGLANRMRNRLDAPLVYFDRNEMAPRIGDLIGFSRTAEVRNRADLERLLPDKFFPSHTDLVIDASVEKLKVIGGNVNDTILTQTVKLDADGKIDPADEHFFVLQVNI